MKNEPLAMSSDDSRVVYDQVEQLAPAGAGQAELSLDQMHEKLEEISKQGAALGAYLGALSHGNLDVRPPKLADPVTVQVSALQAELLLTRELVRRAAMGDYSGRLCEGTIFQELNTVMERLAYLEEQISHKAGASTFSIRESDPMLMAVLDNIQVVIVVVDAKTREVLFINQFACRTLGIAADQLISASSQRDALIQLLISYQGSNEGIQAHRWEAYCTNPMRWYSVSTSAVQLHGGKSVHIHSAVDITEHKRSAKELESFAYLDALTGLPNRREGIAQLEREITSQRNDVISVCFIDMDKLKLINDLHGHEEGDKALLALALAIRNGIRPRDHACRYAGDEFFIVFPRCDQQRAKAIITRIQGEIARYNNTSGNPYAVEFSYGIAEWRQESGMSAKKLLDYADSIMYEQKNHRKRLRAMTQD